MSFQSGLCKAVAALTLTLPLSTFAKTDIEMREASVICTDAHEQELRNASPYANYVFNLYENAPLEPVTTAPRVKGYTDPNVEANFRLRLDSLLSRFRERDAYRTKHIEENIWPETESLRKSLDSITNTSPIIFEFHASTARLYAHEVKDAKTIIDSFVIASNLLEDHATVGVAVPDTKERPAEILYSTYGDIGNEQRYLLHEYVHILQRSGLHANYDASCRNTNDPCTKMDEGIADFLAEYALYRNVLGENTSLKIFENALRDAMLEIRTGYVRLGRKYALSEVVVAGLAARHGVDEALRRVISHPSCFLFKEDSAAVKK